MDPGVVTPEAARPGTGRAPLRRISLDPGQVSNGPPILAAAPAVVRRRGFPWNLLLAVVATPFVLFAVFVAALILSFRMGGEARALRHEVFAASPGEWERQFEFGVGALPSLLARAGLHFVDLEPEARVAIDGFRSADVGVYHRRVAATGNSQTEALTRVDTLMARRGWEPLVSVQDGDQAVRVFLPESLSSLSRLRACVFVMDGDQLVIVSARVDAEPLADLAEKMMSEKMSLLARN